jgi:hypothetical protein
MKKIIVICLIMLLTVGVVFANGLPTYEDGDDSGLISIDENSKISLLEETIRYKIIDEPGTSDSGIWGVNKTYYTDITSNIDVTYHLIGGEESEDTVMYFITPTLKNTSIQINGIDIKDTVSTVPVPRSIDWSPRIHPDSYENDRRYAIKIPLSFKANELKIMSLNYDITGGRNNSSVYINHVYDHVYYLTPAKYWKGDANVNLVLDIPTTLSFKSNIDLKKSGDSIYTTTFEEIPDHEWTLYIARKEGRYFFINNTFFQNIIFIGLFIFICSTTRLIKKEPLRTAFTIVVYIICSFIWFNVNVDFVGYPFGPLFVWAGYFIIGIIIPITFIIKEYNKRQWYIKK